MAKMRSIVKPFPPVRRKNWKKKKLLTVLDNRRQWDREFDPYESGALEIETENGDWLITETSSNANPTYYVTEGS